MLDFLVCHSPEKLAIDAEGIAMARRMLQGIKIHTETLATAFYEGIDFKGGAYLVLKTNEKILNELIEKARAERAAKAKK